MLWIGAELRSLFAACNNTRPLILATLRGRICYARMRSHDFIYRLKFFSARLSHHCNSRRRVDLATVCVFNIQQCQQLRMHRFKYVIPARSSYAREILTVSGLVHRGEKRSIRARLLHSSPRYSVGLPLHFSARTCAHFVAQRKLNIDERHSLVVFHYEFFFSKNKYRNILSLSLPMRIYIYIGRCCDIIRDVTCTMLFLPIIFTQTVRNARRARTYLRLYGLVHKHVNLNLDSKYKENVRVYSWRFYWSIPQVAVFYAKQ